MLAYSPTPYCAAQHSSTDTATNTSTAVVWPGTPFTVPTVVRVVSTTAAALSVAVGTPAPAVATDLALVANLPEYILLPAGSKIGVIANGTAGTVCFTPLT